MKPENMFSRETAEEVKSKKVSFALNHDVAYIYPWSPTKFLIFETCSKEHLKRRKPENDEHLTPILKKTPPAECKDLEDMKFALDELKAINQKPKKVRQTLSFSIRNAFDDYVPKHLEEIQMDEQWSNPPILPNMAIFSPSDKKDLITNSSYCRNICAPQVNTLPNYFKKTERTGRSFDSLDNKNTDENTLPLLPKPKVTGTLFGCVLDKNEAFSTTKYLRIPSIVEAGDNVTNPRQKPLIRNEISQRYAITNTELESIQHLHEEEFSNTETHTSKPQRKQPLPLLRSDSKKPLKRVAQNRSSKLQVTDSNKRKTKPRVNQQNNSLVNTKSCKQELKSLKTPTNPSVLQLCISPNGIRQSSCWKF